MEEVIQLTFDDWLNHRFPASLKYVNEPFERSLHRDNNYEYRLYSLSDDEYQKISKVQNDIFEKSVDYFLQELIRFFEQKFSLSLEKEALVNDELQRLNRAVSDDNFPYGYAFPHGENGVTLIGDNFIGIKKKNGDPYNPLAYWYRHFIVRAESVASSYIQVIDEERHPLSYSVAVHVLYRYKKFLECRLNPAKKDLPPRKAKAERRLPTFDEAIKDPTQLPGLWKHLSDKLDKPFVSEKGVFVGNVEQNASPLMALAYVLIDRQLVKEKPKLSQTNTYRVLCNYFKVPFASAPHKARGSNTYQDVKREVEKYFDH